MTAAFRRGRATTAGVPRPKTGRASRPLRVCGAAVTAGAILFPVSAAHAAESDYGYNFRAVYQGAYQQTLPVEANVSTTSVREAGERVDFRVSVRYGEWQDGWLYPSDAFEATVDLSSLADDVADIDAVFDDMEFTPVRQLQIEREGNVITFVGEFDPEFEEFEVTFSAVFAGGGDGHFAAESEVRTGAADDVDREYWKYGPGGSFGTAVVAANPAPLIAKTVDRTLVTSAAPDVRYSISVTRPEGSAGGDTFVLTDDLRDVILEANGQAPGDFRIERGSGDLAVQDGVLSVQGSYDAAGEFLLTFATPHLGAGDRVLRNTACVQAADRETLVQTDPQVPVSPDPESGTATSAPVPGLEACAAAPEVHLAGEDPDSQPPTPDPGTDGPPAGPAPAPPSGPQPAPTQVPQQLAATGTEGSTRVALLGMSLVVLGGVTACAAAMRSGLLARIRRQRP